MLEFDFNEKDLDTARIRVVGVGGVANNGQWSYISNYN